MEESGGELTMPIGEKVVLVGGGHNALITAFYLAIAILPWAAIFLTQ